MKKREFLKSLALGVAGLGTGRLATAAPSGTPDAGPDRGGVPPAEGAGVRGRDGSAPDSPKDAQSRRPPKNWIWIDKGAERKPDDWKRLLEKLRDSRIDAAIIEVYDGQHAYWSSSRLPVKADVLGTVLPAAKHIGVEIHAWMWTMPCRIPQVMKDHPDWYNVNAKGESAVDKPAYVDYYRFLDPARPEVREFVQKTVAEICDHPGLAGVHLDYVRHPDAILPKALWPKYNLVQDKVYPAFDYGYTEYSRKIFKKKHGVDPMEIKDPTSNEAWMQYRFDAVTDLVNDYLVPAARVRGRLLTAAVFPGPTLARQMVRQDWGRWKLDAFLPMLYNSFYEAGPEWVKQQTEEGVNAVKVPVYSGLYMPASDPAAVAALVRAALTGGAAGTSLFSLGAMSDEKWKAFAGALDAR
jgi:uncharacterized lipoprotein YddW (UPF0748 family)